MITALANCIIIIILFCTTRIYADYSEMDCKLLLVASFLVLLPGVVICDYPWPDNVTQYKGYIQVSPLAAGAGRAGLLRATVTPKLPAGISVGSCILYYVFKPAIYACINCT